MASTSIPQVSGVYRITCIPNGKIYIGSASKLRARWQDHLSTLRRNVHGNRHLQNAWNKYGESAFCFEIIELVAKPELRIREQFWLDTLRPFEHSRGFNISNYADVANRGKPLSPEHKAKLGKSKKGRPSPRKGIHLDADIRAKMSASHKGRKLSPEHVAKAKAGQKPRLNFHHTPETKAKMSALFKGKKFSPEHNAHVASALEKNYIITDPDGKEYRIKGLKRFCEEHNLNKSTMSAVAKGRQMHHKGWHCRKIDK